MILNVCSIRDSATEAFGRPIFVHAVGQAMRSFSDEVNRREAGNDLANHPSDFELYQVATFDDALGLFSAMQPKLLMRGKDARAMADNQE